MKNIKYMKFKIMVILFFVLIAAAAVFFYATRNEAQEYSGLFIRDGANGDGYLYKTQEESGFIEQA